MIKVNNLLEAIFMLLQKLKKVMATLIPLIFLLGCAKFIDIKPGSESINVVNKFNADQCVLKSTVTVSVLSEVGFIDRDPESIKLDLDQLAKNAAIDNQGNTVTEINSSKNGKATYQILYCQ